MTTIHIHYLSLDHIISFYYAYSLIYRTFFPSFHQLSPKIVISPYLLHLLPPNLLIAILSSSSSLFLSLYCSSFSIPHKLLFPHMIGQCPPYSRGNTQRFLWTQVPRLISFLPVKNLSPLHSTNLSLVISLNPQSTPTLALSSMIQKGILRFFISFNFLFPTHSYIRTKQDVCSQQHLQGIFRFHQGHR